jgi:hypothetical protein
MKEIPGPVVAHIGHTHWTPTDSPIQSMGVQCAVVVANEVAAKGPGHAEVTAVNAATEQGLTP